MFYAGKKSRLSQVNRSKRMSRGDNEWGNCPRCGQSMKKQNIDSHIKRVHEHKIVRRRHQSRYSHKVKTIVSLFVILSILSASGYLYQLKKADSSEKNPSPDGTNWLDGYKPKYSFGHEEDDWWIWYPEQHPDAGTSVNHTDWVLDSLEEKPVVNLVHSNNCQPCIQQQKDIEDVLGVFGNNVTYYDLLSGGSDNRSNEAFDVYDPNEGQSNIPLTVMVTLIQDANGNVRVGWHGIEGATGKQWIEDYMKDSIYYYRNNIDNWERNH